MSIEGTGLRSPWPHVRRANEEAARRIAAKQERTLVGWTEGDGSGHEGYQPEDYFDDGRYLGPDHHGIEPIFDPPLKQDQARTPGPWHVAMIDESKPGAGDEHLYVEREANV